MCVYIHVPRKVDNSFSRGKLRVFFSIAPSRVKGKAFRTKRFSSPLFDQPLSFLPLFFFFSPFFPFVSRRNAWEPSRATRIKTETLLRYSPVPSILSSSRTQQTFSRSKKYSKCFLQSTRPFPREEITSCEVEKRGWRMRTNFEFLLFFQNIYFFRVGGNIQGRSSGLNEGNRRAKNEYLFFRARVYEGKRSSV